jgi:predicted phosphodiesterase
VPTDRRDQLKELWRRGRARAGAYRAQLRDSALAHRWHRWRPFLRTAAFMLTGALLAVVLFGRVGAKVGPFDATVAARPALQSQTTVHLAPLGTIVLRTHNWPMALDLRVDQIGLPEAKRIAEHPETIDRLGDGVADDVGDALTRLAWRCLFVAMLGGAAGALLARADWRSALKGAGVGVLLVAVVGGGTALTFNANAVSEPRYTGVLRAAPAAVGDVKAIVKRYGEYRAQLSDLVGNVVKLYLAAENLPTFEPDDGTIRLLHVSDIHLNIQAFDLIKDITKQFKIDAVVDTGDITDWGTEPESRLIQQIGKLKVPYVWVRGNHDSSRTQRSVAAERNAVVLDGDARTVVGLRIWGIGDPRYTPNKDQAIAHDHGAEVEKAEAFAPTVARELAEDTGHGQPPVDLVMVHDSRTAADIGGKVPLVLAGHIHKFAIGTIEATTTTEPEASDASGSSSTTTATTTATNGGKEQPETVLQTEGSTGGAGLRGLQADKPHPLTATVLYFDKKTHRLVAYDRITVKGFGQTGATIDRHILKQNAGG